MLNRFFLFQYPYHEYIIYSFRIGAFREHLFQYPYNECVKIYRANGLSHGQEFQYLYNKYVKNKNSIWGHKICILIPVYWVCKSVRNQLNKPRMMKYQYTYIEYANCVEVYLVNDNIQFQYQYNEYINPDTGVDFNILIMSI